METEAKMEALRSLYESKAKDTNDALTKYFAKIRETTQKESHLINNSRVL